MFDMEASKAADILCRKDKSCVWEIGTFGTILQISFGKFATVATNYVLWDDVGLICHCSTTARCQSGQESRNCGKKKNAPATE